MPKTKKKPRKRAVKKKERGNAYLLPRLKKEHPDIYADYNAGAYSSLAKACQAAGLRPRGDGLGAIKRVWDKSGVSDRNAFLIWATPSTAPVSSAVVQPIVDANRNLSKAVRDFLGAWIFYKSSKIGRVMHDLGFSINDTRLSSAARHGGPLDQEVIDRLKPWLSANGFT